MISAIIFYINLRSDNRQVMEALEISRMYITAVKPYYTSEHFDHIIIKVQSNTHDLEFDLSMSN